MRKFKNIIYFIWDNIILITLTVFCLFVMLFIIPQLKDNVEFDKSEREYYKIYYLEKGKTIGRNSMLEYLYENDELMDDTVDINIQKLMEIEEKNKDKLLNKD